MPFWESAFYLFYRTSSKPEIDGIKIYLRWQSERQKSEVQGIFRWHFFTNCVVFVSTDPTRYSHYMVRFTRKPFTSIHHHEMPSLSCSRVCISLSWTLCWVFCSSLFIYVVVIFICSNVISPFFSFTFSNPVATLCVVITLVITFSLWIYTRIMLNGWTTEYPYQLHYYLQHWKLDM